VGSVAYRTTLVQQLLSQDIMEMSSQLEQA
jgi:hypothetical protein